MSYREITLEDEVSILKEKISSLETKVAILESSKQASKIAPKKESQSQEITLSFGGQIREIHPYLFGLDKCPACDLSRKKSFFQFDVDEGGVVDVSKALKYLKEFLIGEPIVLFRSCHNCRYTWYVHKNERRT